jgi:hypothetical protein
MALISVPQNGVSQGWTSALWVGLMDFGLYAFVIITVYDFGWMCIAMNDSTTLMQEDRTEGGGKWDWEAV